MKVWLAKWNNNPPDFIFENDYSQFCFIGMGSKFSKEQLERLGYVFIGSLPYEEVISMIKEKITEGIK